MKVLLLAILPAFLCAQTSLTLTGPAKTYPGGPPVTLTLTLAGSSGQNLAGLEWTLTAPTGATLSNVTQGAASASATKTPYCNPADTLCLLTGLSSTTPPVITNAVYTDGVVASIELTFPSGTPIGPASIPLTGLLGASLSATSVSISSGPAYSINVTYNPCDVNQDGSVNYSDAELIVQAIIGSASCPATFSAGCSLDSLQAVLTAASGGACSLPLP